MQQLVRQNQIYGMNCISCYNENSLYVCIWIGMHHVIFFLKLVTLQVVVLQLDQILTLHNYYEVQVMVLVVWMQIMQYQSNLLNQEMIGHVCIQVDITHNLTDMGWNPKCNESTLEILNDNIYFNENTSIWIVVFIACMNTDDNRQSEAEVMSVILQKKDKNLINDLLVLGLNDCISLQAGWI